ncbi:MAG: tRNA (guanosine(37)-N1)-methyltransferase TrmD [Bacilli bacterium]
MRIHVLTLFPEMMTGALSASILGRAQAQGFVDIQLTDFRSFAADRHRTVDDYPFGGGAGMVLKPEPLFRAVESIAVAESQAPRVVLMSPQGRPFTQAVARELTQHGHLILVCGHYEGFDERVRSYLADDEISIGDYILTAGELAALVVIDAVVRLLPGVLGNDESAAADSFAGSLLEFPQYTRPREFRGLTVPDVLLSGHHKDMAAWRRRQSIMRTKIKRPDLLEKAELTSEERSWINSLDAVTGIGSEPSQAPSLAKFGLSDDKAPGTGEYTHRDGED